MGIGPTIKKMYRGSNGNKDTLKKRASPHFALYIKTCLNSHLSLQHYEHKGISTWRRDGVENNER